MKRIDSSNARQNVNGAGKKGFHDNADLPGQDATYITPEWLNVIQEELCNILEMNGITLNANARDQLYQLLATNDDLLALATATQQKIDQERDWRTDADNALHQRINQEQNWRTDADNALQIGINNEANARYNADVDLENRKFNKLGGTISGDVSVTGTTRLKRLELFSQGGAERVTLNPENGNYTFYNSTGDKALTIRIDAGVVHFDTTGTDTIQTSSKFQTEGIEIGEVLYNAALIKTSYDQFSFNKPISAPNLFGTQQSWQDVTASRQIGETYFNGTGAPIQVSISVKGGSIRNKVSVDTILISDQMSTYNTGEPIIVSTFIVPVGGTYRIDAPGGTLHIWAELR